MDYQIVYWSNEVGERSFLELKVHSSAPVTCFVGSNEDHPGPEPVGLFQSVASPAEIGTFIETVQRLNSSPRPPLRYGIPGSLIREFRISMAGGPEEIRRAVEGVEPEGAFLLAEKAAVVLARAVRKHPRVALSMEAALVLDGAGHLDVQVHLNNPGSETVRIPHPDLWSDGSVIIVVAACRNDIALADLGSEHQRFLNLSRSQLVDVRPTLRPGKFVAISPGQKLTLKFSAKLPLPQGGYDASLSLTTDLVDGSGRQMLRIESVTQKQRQRVDSGL
jgi:hypothetical protein